MNHIKYIMVIAVVLSSSLYAQNSKFKGEEASEKTINLGSKEALVNEATFKIEDQGLVIPKATKPQELLLKPIAMGLVKPQPFISSHLELQGRQLNHDLITIKYRTSKKGKRWSSWKELPFEGHTDKQTEEKLISSLFYMDKSTKYIQYSIHLTPTKEIVLQNIQLKHYSPGATPKKLQKEINNTAAQSKASCAKPAVVSRSQWGARPPRSSFPTSKVTHLIVHHEFGSNFSSDWAARVRSVQNFHMNSNGWSDIGYNFLIDPNGVIYEGRAGGDSAVGAHFCGRNRNTMGVCMLGNYSSTTPKVATQNSLKKLLAWKANKENINPTGSSYHYVINGSLKNISGHRDGGGCTACPGNGGYAILPSIRTGVQALINNGCSGDGGGSTDTQAPSTTITATGGSTQTGDFTANFNDTDNIGVTRRFYQALEKYGEQWYANRNNGFFNDNFNVFYGGYTLGAGNWSISNSHLRQSNTSSDNTKLSSYVAQNSGLPYLYEFAAKVESTSGPRKFGIHIMADDVTQSQRGNSYLIWFSGEDNKVRIYETINNVLNYRAIGDVPQDNNWANYKITYSPAFGVIEVFKNNISVLRWTDSTPISSGSSISLRTNTTIVEFDDLKVYKFRAGSSLIITAGTAFNKDLRRRNGKIKSLVRDAAGNWSSPGNFDVTISSLTKQNLEDDTKLVDSKIVLYPNPSDGTKLILDYTSSITNEALKISLLDVNGSRLKTKQMDWKGSQSQEIDLTEMVNQLAAGVYFIRVESRKDAQTTKLLIQ
ncbi:N-acetylmuramoyl-L-alanine amidase [Aquimarina brevivitae]|uniref:Putative secreted protein (Por secretion system target) n=1 Tax=Aquimarina brevivitae TaxID=323412 RepID=A0A4Q7PMF1_9FLAO|nr:N-acetylmuramoyl-L-alanine amidase [Aquimarina brevivitae]RZT00183.1 putative secreted protein (Por secretion system target) [Aquimarina brevivitae]